MRLFIILLLCFISTGFAFAQPTTTKTYAETKREQDNKAYNDAYNNSNRVNNNSRGSGRAGVNSDAVNQLAEQFRRNAGKSVQRSTTYEEDEDAEYETGQRKSSSAAEFERQQLESRRIAQAAAEEKRRIAQKKAEAENARWPGVVSNFRGLRDLGFDPTDAFHIADRLTPYGDGSYRGDAEDQKRYSTAIQAFKTYIAIRDTASFNRQLKTIYGFRAAGVTATKALQKLGLKFPAQLAITEQSEFETIPHVFWSDGTVYASDIQPRRDSQRIEAANRYWELFEKYPKSALNSLDLYHPNATDPIQIRMPGVSNKEYNYYAELMLLSNADKDRRESVYDYMVRHNSDDKYWVKKPASFWKEWSTKLGVTPADLVAHIMGSDPGCLKTVCDGTLNTSQFQFQENLLNAILKRMADEGDASCLNAHALRTILYAESGSERKKGYKYLSKAIEAGSMFARFNLLYCAQLGLPDAPDAEKTRQEIIRYLLEAPVEDQYRAVLVITTARGPFAKDLGFLTIGYKLCSDAAAAGHKAAKKSLEWKGWDVVKNG